MQSIHVTKQDDFLSAQSAHLCNKTEIFRQVCDYRYFTLRIYDNEQA